MKHFEKKFYNPNPQFKLRIRIRIVFFVQKWGRIRIDSPSKNTFETTGSRYFENSLFNTKITKNSCSCYLAAIRMDDSINEYLPSSIYISNYRLLINVFSH